MQDILIIKTLLLSYAKTIKCCNSHRIFKHLEIYIFNILCIKNLSHLSMGFWTLLVLFVLRQIWYYYLEKDFSVCNRIISGLKDPNP